MFGESEWLHESIYLSLECLDVCAEVTQKKKDEKVYLQISWQMIQIHIL